MLSKEKKHLIAPRADVSHCLFSVRATPQFSAGTLKMNQFHSIFVQLFACCPDFYEALSVSKYLESY